MPDSFAFGTGAQPPAHSAGPYLHRLTPEEQEIFLSASGGSTLADEIRLFRVVLGILAENIPANHRHMSYVLGTLIRAISAQARQLGSTSEVERALIEAADIVLGLQAREEGDDGPS